METDLKILADAILEGNDKEVELRVRGALDAGVAPERILAEGMIEAMREVGSLFEAGEYYVPEMMAAARAMQAGLGILRPVLVASGVKRLGKVLIGTVKGDLHDIGKNLVVMMLEGAGYEVVDLGTDVTPQRLAAAVREHMPQIVGMSALLTTTMQNMRDSIEALEDMGVRESVKVIVGGAPVTSEFAGQIGADGYAPDASRAVSLVRSLI